MYWYSTILSLFLLFAAATSISIALFSWRRRVMPGITAFTVTMLAITQWSLAFLAQMVSVDFAHKLAWAKFQHVGLLVLPVAWLVFSFQYTGRGRLLTPQNLLSLSLMPVISFCLILTNDTHLLFWQDVTLQTVNGLPLLAMTPAFWYWVTLAFLYLCFLVGSLLLLTSQRYEIASLAPRQALVLISGLLLPWFGLTLQLVGLSAINLTPLAFAVSGIVVACYALRFCFVRQTPLANQVVLNSLGDGLLALDPDLRVVDANAAAEAILQRPLSAIVNQPLTVIWPELATQYPYVQQQPLDIAYHGSSGLQFYEVSFSLLMDWRRLPSAHLLLLHDITQRKQQESRREEYTHTLVHDLRSPISNSLFALQMLKNNLAGKGDATGSHELVDLTVTNTEKILHLVNNILDVARMQEDQWPINRTAVFLDKLVAQVVKGHLAHAQEKQICLHYHVPADLPPAWADANLLERVLQNLIDNSLKFTAVGGVVNIRVALASEPAIGQALPARLEVSVSDDGPGLPPELIASVFNKYVTGESKESGNGLGLAFCQMVLDAHNERIWVENNAEAGVTFTFSLTAVATPAKTTETETAVGLANGHHRHDTPFTSREMVISLH
jgi:signal transduction histidine kinase